MMVVLATTSGCAMIPTRALRPDERIVTGRASEGYIVLAVSGSNRPDTDLFGVSLCDNGDLNRCVVIGPQNMTEGYRAYAVPPGTWCITEAWMQNGDFYLDVPADRAHYQCFSVVENTANYPGHLELHSEPTQFPGSALSTFALYGVAGAREQAQAKYPALADVEWVEPVVGPLRE